MPELTELSVRLTHTGIYADGRPNPSGILIEDLNTGVSQQYRKIQVYIPSGATVELPLTSWVMFSFVKGDIDGFIRTNQLTYELPIRTAGEATKSWSFETSTSKDYFGGFYKFGPTDDDFAPSITFGVPNQACAAHFFVVTGAVPANDVVLTITGTTITDEAVRTPVAVVTLTIPAGTPVNSYIETPEKWNGQLTIETTSGSPITCNYGSSKYYDNNNRNYRILGFETVWESLSNDSNSDIKLIHHKSTGWTFNAGSEPTPPYIYSRSDDYGPDVVHVSGEGGSWKRANLSDTIQGNDSEGIIWEVVSGSTGLGSQSFRDLTALLIIKTEL